MDENIDLNVVRKLWRNQRGKYRGRTYKNVEGQDKI